MSSPEIFEELKFQVHQQVYTGFYSLEEIIERTMEDVEDGGFSDNPEDIDKQEALTFIKNEWAKKQKEEQSWSAKTMCDRLSKAFEQLTASGIISIENAGYTMSDGWDDYREAASKCTPGSVRGGCFYHGQDLERAVEGGGIFIAFGAAVKSDEEAELNIAREIVQCLKENGFEPEWEESITKRIFLPIDWKRRYKPDTPSHAATEKNVPKDSLHFGVDYFPPLEQLDSSW